MARKVLSYYPAQVLIDGEYVDIRVTRLPVEQMGELNRDYKRMADPPSNRMLFERRDTPDEQEKDEKGEFKIDLASISERRLKEMTPEQRAAYDKQDALDEAFAKKFTIETISSYVSVVEGQLEEEDDTPVTTGRQMLKLYGGRRDVLAQLMLAVYCENTMTESAKKVSRSLSDLKRSWERQVLALAGEKPEPAADDAVNAASADPGDATASSEQTPSGSATTGAAIH